MPLLLREAIGGTIRRARTERRRTLRDVSREARVSLGYLSEVERGRKEPSSELIASICEALALPLPDLLDDVAESMRPTRVRAPRPVALASAGVDPALRSAVEEAFEPAEELEPLVAADPADPTTAGDDAPGDDAEVAPTVLDSLAAGEPDEDTSPEAPGADPRVTRGVPATPVRLVPLVTVGTVPAGAPAPLGAGAVGRVVCSAA